MRAKTGSKFIITFSLVFLLAIFLFSFVLSVDLASASPSVNYITAEVTTSTGDFLPAGMVYDKTAVDLSFALYTSEDRATWTRDDSFAAKFDLKYYTAIGAALSSAPSEVGSYRVDVVAKDSTLAEYFNEDLYSIVKDTVIGSAAFTIYNQNLYLYNTLLDADASNGDSISGVGNLLAGFGIYRSSSRIITPPFPREIWLIPIRLHSPRSWLTSSSVFTTAGISP